MPVELATLGLRLSNAEAIADAKATGAAYEDMGKKGEAAARKLTLSTNPVTSAIREQSAATVSATRGMSAWSAVQAEAAGHVGEHSLNISRLERNLASTVEKTLGVNAAMGLLGTTFLKFGVGDIYTVAIVGGFALLASYYDLLTEGSRKYNEQIDSLTKSLNEQAKAAHLATAAGKEEQEFIAGTNLDAVKRQSAVGFKSIIGSILAGRPMLDPSDVGDLSTRTYAVAGAQTQAQKEAAQKYQEDEDKRKRQAEEEARKRDARDRAAREAQARESELVKYYGASGQPMTRAEGRIAAAGTGLSDAEAQAITKQLGFEFIAPKITIPAVKMGDSLTDLQKQTEKLINPFILAKEATAKFVDSLVSARGRLANVREAFKGGNILSGAQAGAEGGIADALSQFTPEALTYKAVTAGINFIAQGFTDMATSMLDGGAGAREYARALRQQTDEYAAAIAQFKHDDLAASLAQNAATSEQLIKQMQDLYGNVTAVVKLIQQGGQSPQSRIDEIRAQEAKNAEIIKRQAQYAQEDLAVRNLRATGQGDAANLLALREQQQREYQAAIDANKDATYLNTLATTQNNELIAFQNGLLSTALRNAPTGFYASAYYQQYATPRGDSGNPSGGGGGVTTDPSGTHGLSPHGGSRQRPIVSTIVMLDGKVLVRAITDKLDQTASATGGAGSSRSDALNVFR